MRKNGFTLVELLVVISVMTLLAALLLPALQGALISARRIEGVGVRRMMGFREAKIPESILFIGNSLTAYSPHYNVPNTVEDMMRNGPLRLDDLYVKKEVTGAATLKMHYENPAVINQIELGIWDVVVIQEQSSAPQYIPNETLEYGEKLGKLIRKNDAQPVLYAHWERHTESGSYPTEFNKINKTFTQLADKINSPIVPSGYAFKKWEKESGDGLYMGDNIHPNKLGAYLSTSVFYSSFTGVINTEVPYSLSDESSIRSNSKDIHRTAINSVIKYIEEKDDIF